MNLTDTLLHLAKNPCANYDVAEIALHIARDEFPHLDVEAYLGELDAMAHEMRCYLRGNLSAQLKGMCRYLFHEMGFRGNVGNYYDPFNSYLNIVLESRTGIPITLSAVAMAIGRRAGLEITGVGLPGHFVAKVSDGKEEILFDPFHGGRQIQPQDCETLVMQITGMNFRATPDKLQAIPLGSLVQRMLSNLKAVYLRQSDFHRGIRVIERLQQLNPRNPLHDRDLGACCLRNGQPGKAIDYLQAYLYKTPNAEDTETVEELLNQAQDEVAKWN